MTYPCLIGHISAKLFLIMSSYNETLCDVTSLEENSLFESSCKIKEIALVLKNNQNHSPGKQLDGDMSSPYQAEIWLGGDKSCHHLINTKNE